MRRLQRSSLSLFCVPSFQRWSMANSSPALKRVRTLAGCPMLRCTFRPRAPAVSHARYFSTCWVRTQRCCPRIVALGEIDEDELIFADVAAGAPALDIAPKMSGLERRLLLANLIATWARQLEPRWGEPPLVVAGPTSALALADDLARLIDDMITRQIDWKELSSLVPQEHDEYWQRTLEFLKVASDLWPDLSRPAAR